MLSRGRELEGQHTGVQKVEKIMHQTVKPLIEVRNITKEFPGVKALNGVSFDIRPGEVHALVGENGAGKSTIIKILMGVYTKTSGEIYLNGEKILPELIFP